MYEPRDVAEAALNAAVLHHGLANLSQGAVPASANKVTETAHIFAKWLAGIDD